MSSFKFQVNLGGIIELLSNHLYGSPEVYVRELLQNAVDAITARRALEPGHAGSIGIEIQEKADGGPTSIVVTDDGVGLTEADVHRFLATIGESSKRVEGATDFIGQFGIGLLSCFVVSDEIVVVTHARGSAPVEWRGRGDGTYDVRPHGDESVPIGTRVHLKAKPDAAELFEPDRVIELARRFGGLLPFPMHVRSGDREVAVHEETPPFRVSFSSALERRTAALAYGKKVFGLDFVDAIPLRSERGGGVTGVAFVLPYTTSSGAKRADRVYLKNMLLSTSAEQLLPSWSFFVRCVVDVNGGLAGLRSEEGRALRPNAARDALYEDAELGAVRDAFGKTLRDYLGGLAARDAATLHQIVALHGTSLKELCLDDDDLCRALVDFLPFETTLGEKTLGALRREVDVVRYAPTVDVFRQIAQVATAEGLAIVNAGYVHDAALLARLPDVFPGQQAVEVRASDLTRVLGDLSFDELESAGPFLRVADAVLVSCRCRAELKRFAPDSVAVLYTASELAAFRRAAQRTSKAAGGGWGAILDRIVESGDATEAYATLTFNVANPLVQRLIAHAKNRDSLCFSIRALYTQALLLGHHPLDASELAANNESMMGLVELASRPHREDA